MTCSRCGIDLAADNEGPMCSPCSKATYVKPSPYDLATCPRCGFEFAYDPDHIYKYCEGCRREARRREERERNPFRVSVCQSCGINFPDSKLGRRRSYCSELCRARARKERECTARS